MAFSKATPPKVPKSIGLVSLNVWTDAGERNAVGSVEVQVRDDLGNTYEKSLSGFAETVSPEIALAADNLLALIRSEAEKEIL